MRNLAVSADVGYSNAFSTDATELDVQSIKLKERLDLIRVGLVNEGLRDGLQDGL